MGTVSRVDTCQNRLNCSLYVQLIIVITRKHGWAEFLFAESDICALMGEAAEAPPEGTPRPRPRPHTRREQPFQRMFPILRSRPTGSILCLQVKAETPESSHVSHLTFHP